jgi:hypothetical protein
LEAREAVLSGALETLAASATRQDYDERLRLGEVSEEVPSEYVAATLALLQESGDAQTVVAAGEAWLATHRRHRNARDVAIAVGMAHCDLARAILDARRDIQSAVSTLQVASSVLRRYKAGTDSMLQGIEDAIADLQPLLVLEVLAKQDDDAAARARGLKLLPAVLKDLAAKATAEDSSMASHGLGHRAAADRGDLSRSQFVERLRELLTAEEHVELYAAVGGDPYASTPPELYSAAMVHVAAGAAGRKPTLIARAAEILSRANAIDADMEAAAAAMHGGRPAFRDGRRLEDRQRRAVLSCVVALLLGDSTEAGAALGLGDGRIKCDRQVLAFIRSHSPDAATLLPGVCTLVERWINEVALATYATSATHRVTDENYARHGGLEATTFSLNAWFEDPVVVRELEARQRGGGSGSGAAAMGPLHGITSALSALVGLFFAPAPFENQTAAESEGAANLTEPSSTLIPAPPPSAAAVTSSPPAASSSVSSAGGLSVDARSPSEASQEPASATATEATPATPPTPPNQPVQQNKPNEEQQETPPSSPSPSSSFSSSSSSSKTSPLESVPLSPSSSFSSSTSSPLESVPLSPSSLLETELTTAFENADDTEDTNDLLVDEDTGEFLAQPVALEAITPLRGEDAWMRSAYDVRRLRWDRVAVASMLLIGGAAFTARALISPPVVASLASKMGLSSTVISRLSSPSVQLPSSPSSTSTVLPSHGEATALVKRWQSIKAAALGPKHDLKAMATVLSGPLYDQWHRRASSLAQRGWYYTHALHGCKIVDIRPGAKPGIAVVTAVVKEGVTVQKPQESAPQMFESEYKVLYQMQQVQGRNGGSRGSSWALVDAVVQNTN